jgi:Trk-type K+ transport system membrane component
MSYPEFLRVLRRRRWALAFFVALVCLSTLAFSFVEKHTLFDSFYWTITVISTVGFGDITPHTQIGKLIFIIDAVSGINVYIYLITSWQASLIEERLERRLWKAAELEAKARAEKENQAS